MKEEDIQVNLEELRKFKEQNAEERAWFIDFWVNYIKTHKDSEWSEHQNALINSQLSHQ